MNDHGPSDEQASPAAAPPVEQPSVQPPTAPPIPERRPYVPPVPQRVKVKIDVVFLILGFVSPILLGSAFQALAVVADSIISAYLAQALLSALPIALLALFLIGKIKANRRMFSFGLGGLLALAVGALLLLLAFGSCLVMAGTSGLM